MSLATRCPACGTIFRVVQDQLRVSQGWVRCGRCSEAFNALDSLVELAPATDPLAAPVVPATAAASAATAAPAVGAEPAGVVVEPPAPAAQRASADPPDEGDETTSSAAPDVDLRDQAPDQAPDHAPDAAPAQALDEGPDDMLAVVDLASVDIPPGVECIASDGAVSAPGNLDEAAAGRTDPSFGFDEPLPVAPGAAPAGADVPIAAPEASVVAAEAPLAAGVVEPDAPAVATAGAGSMPSFVAQADRAERWRRPQVRLALALAALTAAALLALQATHAYRDRIAASYPGLRPVLQQGCAWLGCRVGDYRQIDALSVESTALVRVEGSPVYRLAVTLRNRASVEVAAPALDLTINDAQGRAIARRMLQMNDLNLPLRVLKPGSEVPIQVPLGIADRQVSGYTVELFYP